MNDKLLTIKSKRAKKILTEQFNLRRNAIMTTGWYSIEAVKFEDLDVGVHFIRMLKSKVCRKNKPALHKLFLKTAETTTWSNEKRRVIVFNAQRVKAGSYHRIPHNEDVVAVLL
ncbi:MAG: hypothetical protein V1928_05400 [Parcubacteria group bacterium]